MTKPSLSDGFFALRDHCFAVFYKVPLPGDCHAALAMTLSALHGIKKSNASQFIKRFSSR